MKLLTKHRISLIVNLILALLHRLQIGTSTCAEADFVFSLVYGSKALDAYISLSNTVVVIILKTFTESFFFYFYGCTIQNLIVTVK